MLEPNANHKKVISGYQFSAGTTHWTVFSFTSGSKFFFFNLIMFSVTATVFLLLIFSTSYLRSATLDAEERKNFKTIFDLLMGISKGFYFEFNGLTPSSRLDCPLCDSSVYSYCSEKLLHDACCCLNPYEHKLPQQCKYADCGFLHANSCREHKLITACCCSKLL